MGIIIGKRVALFVILRACIRSSRYDIKGCVADGGADTTIITPADDEVVR